MSTSIFDEKLKKPNESDISEVLGDIKSLWDELKKYVYDNYEAIKEDWKFYSKKSGWTLLYKQKDKTLLYFIPCDGYFKVLFVFSEKAVKRAVESSLPNSIISLIEGANLYAEGRSFFIDIKEESDLQYVRTLLEIKTRI